MRSAAIGFDLGTSTCAAATIGSDGSPYLITAPGGSRLVPSVVFFDDKVRIGDKAIECRRYALDNYADSFKRDIGKPHYRKPLRTHNVPPEVLTGFVVEYLANYAHAAVGDFESVVATVPAYFDERQRTATRRAVALAGLNTLQVINEPTAAAIAAGHKMLAEGAIKSGHTILVYDLGGGTFDATLLEIDGRVFKTRATDGEIYLGGRDFNQRVADIVAESFLTSYGIDPRSDPADFISLLLSAKSAKHQLTDQESVEIEFEHAGFRNNVTVNRSAFEEAIEPLIERSLMTCQATLADAGCSLRDVDQILLVGGSSRIPLVRQRLSEASGREIELVDEPDELVAKGAALYSAVISKHPSLPIESRFEVVNVNSHSLGIQGVDLETKQAVNKIMIPRNTPLPVSTTASFSTVEDNQPNVRVRLLEGESENPAYCSSLGQCVVQLQSSLPAKTAVHVSCRYDAGGTISVDAMVPSTGAEASVVWNREGFDEIDPLNRWRQRLTTGADSLHTAESNANLLPRVSTLRPDTSPSDLMRRLDQLYEHIAVTYSVTIDQYDADPDVAATKTLLEQTRAELRTLERLINRLRDVSQTRDDDIDPIRVQGDLSRVRVTHFQTSRLHQHSRISLGQAFFDAANEELGDPLVEQEVKELRSWLDAMNVR